jgi:hypothetical protein
MTGDVIVPFVAKTLRSTVIVSVGRMIEAVYMVEKSEGTVPFSV